MIAAGKVTVNGQVVTEPGVRADPLRDHITVDGRAIPREVPRLYVLLNKPKGYVTTREDPHATHTVMDLIRPPLEARLGRGSAALEGLHPVGRLDAQTEGLLIMTNDGAFTHALTHPRHGVPKVYRADVKGVPDPATMERLRAGIPLFGRRTQPARARVVRADRSRDTAVVEVELREGRNQQVRRMLQAVHHPVNRLTRVAVGPLSLDRLKPGQWRFLTDAEVQALWKAATPEKEAAPPARPAPPAPPRRPARPSARTGPKAAGRPAPPATRPARKPRKGQG